jgi:hypothetical protein
MTEREEPVGYRTGLDHVVEQFIASGTAAAADVEPRHRWVFLTFLAEAHQRAGAAIRELARQNAPRAVRRGPCA